MALNSTDRVVRRVRPLAGSYGPYPYASGTDSGKEEMKEELVRLGVKLSLSVVEGMFLLCDDIHTMLSFCFKLWRLPVQPPKSPTVRERLTRVIHDVYLCYIKPKNIAYQAGGNSVQFELIRTNWHDFTNGIIVFHRLVRLLRRKDCSSYDNRLLSSAVAEYKQALEKLDDKMSCAKHVSEANGFVRETVESKIYGVWKSLFDDDDDDDDDGEAGEEEEKIPNFNNLFQLDVGAKERGLPIWGHRGIQELPIHFSYILSHVFAREGLREEVVKLGVEFSLYVAESMFLLCDDIRSVLLFCSKIRWITSVSVNRDKPMYQRLLRGMYHVYTKHIKPKHGVYDENGARSVQWKLASTTWEDFDVGIKDLDLLLWILRGKDSFIDGRELMSSVEKALKKIEEKMRCAKDISEANGYERDAIESYIHGFWKSVFNT